MDIGRNTQGEDARASVATGESVAPAQNNATPPTEQPTAGSRPSWRARTARLAPWIIQLVWLTAGVATIAYLNSRTWGMFEALPLMIAAGFGITAWLQWTIAWALLVRQSITQRLAGLMAGLLGVLVISDLIFEWRQDDLRLVMTLVRIAVGISLPLLLVCWRGWRIQMRQYERQATPPPVPRRGQFSIGELLLLTAGTGIFLSLMMARENFGLHDQWGEIMTECVIVVCGSAIVIVGLAARSFAKGALISSGICLATMVAALVSVDADVLGRPIEWLLIVLICWPAIVGLLATIGLVRWWGYRLVPPR